MRPLGFIKTETQTYKITKQEKGYRRASGTPRCPVIIYEKATDGGWSHLAELDAEAPRSDKKSASPILEDDSTSWQNAKEEISFFDDSDIVEERRRF